MDLLRNEQASAQVLLSYGCVTFCRDDQIALNAIQPQPEDKIPRALANSEICTLQTSTYYSFDYK